MDVIFVVLTAESTEGRNRSFFRELFLKKQVQIEYQKAGKIRFAVIRWPGSLSDLDWEQIAEISGRAGRMLVLPRQVEPPEEWGLSRLSVWEYADQVARECALQILQKAPMPLYRKTIGVVDPRGTAAGFVRQAIRHASVVRVATSNPALYDGIAEEMMETYGASVLISKNQDDACRSALVYAPHGLVDRHSREILPPIISTDRVELMGRGRVIHGFSQQVPPWILKMKPPLITEQDFLAALWQMCGLKELSALPICRCRVGEREVEISQVAAYVAKTQQKQEDFSWLSGLRESRAGS